jgi:putative transposase
MQVARNVSVKVRRANSVQSSLRAEPAVQLELPLPSGWGGRRVGAGRPRMLGRGRVAHHRRPAHRAEHPVHVTLRSACRSLRTQFVFPTVRRAIAAANRVDSQRFRVAQYSVQGDHVHLLVEASDRVALIEGVRGLSIRIARRVNKLLSRRGRFFADRWHGRALASPRAVRNALVYVLANFRKHQVGTHAILDVYSSAPYFTGFIEFPYGAPIHEPGPCRFPTALAPPGECAVVPARSWLLSVGWKRHGNVSIAERPASSPE